MADLSRAFPSISEIATLLAPITNPELAKGYSSQPPLWRPLTRRTDRTYFGRKRRARRARGRQIEAGRNTPYVGGRIWVTGRRAGLRSDRSKWTTLLYDEVDSYPTGELTIEQWAAARQTMQRQRGEQTP